MITDEQFQELMGQLRMLDTKIGFLENDLSELREMLGTLGETSVATFAQILVALDTLNSGQPQQGSAAPQRQSRNAI